MSSVHGQTGARGVKAKKPRLDAKLRLRPSVSFTPAGGSTARKAKAAVLRSFCSC